MRKIFVTLSAAAMLAACATTPTGGIDIAAFTKIVGAYTVAACSFVPLASGVANILAKNNAALQTAQAIADLICASVNPPAKVAGRMGASRTPVVIVDGQSISVPGTYVR